MRIQLKQAVSLLQSGNVVSIPTETVYGLAAWIHSPDAIAQVFQLKNRPAINPLILHLAKTDQILHYVSSVPDEFFSLAKAFWPGPLTIILPVNTQKVPSIARAELETCAFRIPSHPIAQQLLEHVWPLVAPSANLSGRPSSTKAEHVEADFGQAFPVLDGGFAIHGVESTIIAHIENQWQIVRQGAISQEALALHLGYVPEKNDSKKQSLSEKPLCPGQLFRHYAPNARLVLSEQPYSKGMAEIVVGFSDRHYPGATKVYSLGSSQNSQEAAFSLYDVLRRLDLDGVVSAWVDMQLPKDGLWQTIHERLSRAANR